MDNSLQALPNEDEYDLNASVVVNADLHKGICVLKSNVDTNSKRIAFCLFLSLCISISFVIYIISLIILENKKNVNLYFLKEIKKIFIYNMCDIKFHHPFRCLIAGPSSSGKTNIAYNIILSQAKLIEPRTLSGYRNVFYFYNTWQPVYSLLSEINLVSKFIKGTPSSEQFKELAEPTKKSEGCIFIVDDAINEPNSDMQEIFTTLSHHYNASIIFITQNLFPPVRNFRTISLNSEYIFAMKSPRDQKQLKYFAMQMFPNQSNFVMKCYEHATSHPYSYLLFDAHQKTPDGIRLRSKVLPFEGPMIVYTKKIKCIIFYDIKLQYIY